MSCDHYWDELLARLPEPKNVWRHFFELCKVPRGSGNCEGIRNRLIEIAHGMGCEAEADEAGNLILRKPGVEGKPIVCLQGHMDMVNQKVDNSTHDFSVDPIRPRIDGPYLKATGTSLGADNGIGVALGLAILEDRDLRHPPLEMLITRDEEIGLVGASRMPPGLLRSKYLINVDSEEEFALCIGCAGGYQVNIDVPSERRDPFPGYVPYRLYLHGLKGGHSGVDINLGRANALKIVPRLLIAASRVAPYQLVSLIGGTAHNAIPRSAEAFLYIPEAQAEAFRAAVFAEFDIFRRDYLQIEPDSALDLSPCSPPELPPLTLEDTTRVIDFFNIVPFGVVRMSPVVQGLVQTSYTLAVCNTDETGFHCVSSARSPAVSEKNYVYSLLHSLCRNFGAVLSPRKNEYPGWEPDTSHHLFHTTKAAHSEALGREPHVYAIHAGLECGLIKERYPHMDMVSVGPEINFPHSPDERLLIESVPRLYHLLTRTLAKLAK